MPLADKVWACSRALTAWARADAPSTYTTNPTGSMPYSKKVITAPSTVPVLLVASATAIINVT